MTALIAAALLVLFGVAVLLPLRGGDGDHAHAGPGALTVRSVRERWSAEDAGATSSASAPGRSVPVRSVPIRPAPITTAPIVPAHPDLLPADADVPCGRTFQPIGVRPLSELPSAASPFLADRAPAADELVADPPEPEPEPRARWTGDLRGAADERSAPDPLRAGSCDDLLDAAAAGGPAAAEEPGRAWTAEPSDAGGEAASELAAEDVVARAGLAAGADVRAAEAGTGALGVAGPDAPGSGPHETGRSDRRAAAGGGADAPGGGALAGGRSEAGGAVGAALNSGRHRLRSGSLLVQRLATAVHIAVHGRPNQHCTGERYQRPADPPPPKPLCPVTVDYVVPPPELRGLTFVRGFVGVH